jgi:hypothetical protein
MEIDNTQSVDNLVDQYATQKLEMTGWINHLTFAGRYLVTPDRASGSGVFSRLSFTL